MTVMRTISYGKILEFLFNIFLIFISFFVRRRKNLWVFGSWLGERIDDNPYYLYQETVNAEGIIPIWIFKNRELVISNNSDIEAYYYLSLRGIYYQLKCGVCVVSHSVRGDLLWGAINNSCFKVNTWHGSPVKKILNDVEDINPIVSATRKYLKFLLPAWSPVYDLVLSASPQVTMMLKSAFGNDAVNIIEIGYPRVEAMLKAANVDENNKCNSRYRIAYLPTLRQKTDIDSVLFYGANFDVAELDEALDAENAVLEIKLHPVNDVSESLRADIAKSKNISLSACDTNSLLVSADMLITDYSSVYIDYLMLDRPIIFSRFDEDSFFVDERALYFDLEAVSWGPYLKSWRELQYLVRSLRTNDLPSDQIKVKEVFNSVGHGHVSSTLVSVICERCSVNLGG